MNKYNFFFFIAFTVLACRTDKVPVKSYKTEYVVIVVMDGARYSETFGDSTHQYISCLADSMKSVGVVNQSFYNNGVTNTTSGHVAITTGYYEVNINNGGSEFPTYHSLFQDWLKLKGSDSHDAWVIASKDKLEVLANTKQANWNNIYQPNSDCGISGLGSGYRSDSITFERSKKVLGKYHPHLLLINFKDPDVYGHAGQWSNYLNSISKCDQYIYTLWKFIQQDEQMAGKTTLIVTNDHGRHTTDYVSHGDNCDGCRHIFFYASGPDFVSNKSLSVPRSMIDIHATVSELFHLPNKSSGNVMSELFN